MRTSDFDFDLPPERIAQQPAEPRDSARLMLLSRSREGVQHHRFSHLPSLLSPGDLLVVNDTKVMAARLFGIRPDSGGRVEALLLRPMPESGGNAWEVLMYPLRQAVAGRSLIFETSDGPLAATVASRQGETAVLEFAHEFDPATVGTLPLPPYIKDYTGDPGRYQTVYANEPRSAAAPTAGLHFTPGLFASLERQGVERTSVTLEVGIGTFKPVKEADPRDHALHEERVIVSRETADVINRAKADGRRVIAVGTTVVRTLEHVARQPGGIQAYFGQTGLRILPGDPFLAVDGIITNFHLPKSTLLMLICAFAGTEKVLHGYREAISAEYNFYSFGDAMLILP
jgi:S-adenosylmethionine:tRNA ribosyltransferase-isomerase